MKMMKKVKKKYIKSDMRLPVKQSLFYNLIYVALEGLILENVECVIADYL